MARRGKGHTKRRHTFPFLGLLRCGECGGAITAERQKGHHYYRCTKKLGPCTQRYIREETLAAQVREVIQQVALSDAWAEKMRARIEEWKATAAQTSDSFAQESQARLSAIQARLDRLLDAHLDGAVTREEYLGRKEKLLHEKAAVTDRLAEIERNGNHWLEPLENFINAAHQAQIVAGGHDLESLKDFLKRIGSNLRLSGRAARAPERRNRNRAILGARPSPRSIGENEKWWAPWESNPAPTDYAYHYGFRRPFRVCGLDSILPLRPSRRVSTRSPGVRGLRSVSAWRKGRVSFHRI